MQEDTTKKEEEKEAEKPQNELEECQKKCDEYLNNWKRERADFLNYKKDEMERIGMLANYTREDMIYKILPIFDNIYLAQKQIPPAFAQGSGEAKEEIKDSGWMQGFLQIKNQVREFLKKEGIEEIETLGKKFDPISMEVVEEVDLPADLPAHSAQAGASAKKEGGGSGTVIEELQKGYIMASKVLRPARVKVSK